ncbi:Feruloyl esterase B [Pseudocercospora fuligena]|uniref:feruloyl esterase n=1 Tax=Pseudocercospora fuligena TaxID=685502 RepID=A0A8H6VFW7_9PEZI|nr:Feruloyl esterase B [Pseudocercospora fuligena]
MASSLFRMRSLGTLCLALAVAAFADKSESSTSTTSSASSIATHLNFVVPEPISAPGVNTSSGCGKELDSDYEPGGDTAGPFEFNTTDGYGRKYTIHIPKYYDINKASPLIFGFPGNTNTYKDIEDQTELSDESMNPYAIAVYVSGVNLGFVSNPGYGATKDATFPKVDDISFMEDFIEDLEGKFCIDTGRIWAVGHSNGGGLVNVMACDPTLSTKITAFAANSGAFYTNFTDGDPKTIDTGTTTQGECLPAREHIPFIEFHGTDDDVVEYEGADDHSSYGIRVLPDIQHWASSWAVRDGYSIDNVTSRPDDDVKVYQWGGPDNLGVVTHYRLNSWIHDYARKSAGAPIDATPIIMEFFYNQTNYTTTSTTTSTGTPTPTSSATASSTSSAAAGKLAESYVVSVVAGLALAWVL